MVGVAEVALAAVCVVIAVEEAEELDVFTDCVAVLWVTVEVVVWVWPATMLELPQAVRERQSITVDRSFHFTSWLLSGDLPGQRHWR